jgi:hypothetical protein
MTCTVVAVSGEVVVCGCWVRRRNVGRWGKRLYAHEGALVEYDGVSTLRQRGVTKADEAQVQGRCRRL